MESEFVLVLALIIIGIGLLTIIFLLRDLNKNSGVSQEALGKLLRDESDRIRQSVDEQSRISRVEMSDTIRTSGETTRTTLNDSLKQFGDTQKERLDKFTEELKSHSEILAKSQSNLRETLENRQSILIQTIDSKLVEMGSNQDKQAKSLREEMTESFGRLGHSLNESLKIFGDSQKERLNKFTEELKSHSEILAKSQTDLRETLEKRLNILIQTIDSKLVEMGVNQDKQAKDLREEMTGNVVRFGHSLSESLKIFGDSQKERLEAVTQSLLVLSERHDTAQKELKLTVENRLDVLRTENTQKLEDMRKTVDEKLQATLETRLGESFTRVVEQLERVHKGIGEMQNLAAGVGDLKKLLSNVRVRGTWGEVQLGAILEQMLTPDQFIKNAQIKEGSQERVEFAILLPGQDEKSHVLLPIDAKFPQEDYDRLLSFSENGDAEGIAQASKELENRIRSFAKTIREKYIDPPKTTDFAILFLPTEGLYAEILRRPGVFEQIQKEFHVTLTGPTTLSALLNALQMGFRTLLIEKRSSEVWKILGAVSAEFSKYNEVVDKLSKQLDTAVKSVEKLGTRTRAMNRKLTGVEKLPDESAQLILGPAIAAEEGAYCETEGEEDPLALTEQE